jgi:cation transport protein ChaC
VSAARETGTKPRWVFGYGSLMWNPGFATPETRAARLQGWHRARCIYSDHYRGTPKQPGLILGLLPGGSCRGLAHRLPAERYDAVRRYLIRREIDNDGVYQETIRPIHLDNGRTVPALVYLADRRHRQFRQVATPRPCIGPPGRRHGQQPRLCPEHHRHLASWACDRALEELAPGLASADAPSRSAPATKRTRRAPAQP